MHTHAYGHVLGIVRFIKVTVMTGDAHGPFRLRPALFFLTEEKKSFQGAKTKIVTCAIVDYHDRFEFSIIFVIKPPNHLSRIALWSTKFIAKRIPQVSLQFRYSVARIGEARRWENSPLNRI